MSQLLILTFDELTPRSLANGLHESVRVPTATLFVYGTTICRIDYPIGNGLRTSGKYRKSRLPVARDHTGAKSPASVVRTARRRVFDGRHLERSARATRVYTCTTHAQTEELKGFHY